MFTIIIIYTIINYNIMPPSALAAGGQAVVLGHLICIYSICQRYAYIYIYTYIYIYIYTYGN